MKKISLSPQRLLGVVALAVMLIAAVPAVSAETINGQINDISMQEQNIFVSGNPDGQYIDTPAYTVVYDADSGLIPTAITLMDACIYIQTLDEYTAYPNYQIYNCTLRHGDRDIATSSVTIIKNDYVPKSPTVGQGYGTIKFQFTDWDYTYLETLSGIQNFKFYGLPTYPDSKLINMRGGATYIDESYPVYFISGSQGVAPYSKIGYHIVDFEVDYFKNSYTIDIDEHGTNIYIIRIFDNKSNPSKLIIYKNDGTVIYESPEYETADRGYAFPYGDLTIDIQSKHGKTYRIVGDSLPPENESASITVYVKNSQTGAAIANSNVVIDALVNGEYYPVANTTEPSGIFTINLQPTGGGQPNPDSYRLIATADGYNNPMPEINFTVTDSKKYIYCYLDPIAGGPENENNTFIDFYVRDLSANPVSGATVKFDKYTLITNSQGYTVFEVNKNATYTYTVSKSGYGSLTGNAVIGANDRYIINTVLGPSVTPTAPTAIPTATQTGPTPTLTAPTGEPVSNLLEWFAAHFGMLLGGGVEIGKIFMWLCFTVPVGVYVGKEAKAGAAGFMAGAGIVTLFFVVIGWVPIWLVILLALIIGLMYLKIFNAPDNGGGR